MTEQIQVPITLLQDLVDSGECWFDHNGDCQEHGYILKPVEQCPQYELKEILSRQTHRDCSS